ncbi:hypothetical protein B0A48_01638 [Cryoendolithus antarcticus]|uniref:Uncharacterized protein n=1 Tax=Cryoendolithus antarcticus TaxID=1507870 RepID=A0A1V8TPV7_9PEZI|nr:hypothetical protein B0A48_01638 [Cryoendolithus antarcticus]
MNSVMSPTCVKETSLMEVTNFTIGKVLTIPQLITLLTGHHTGNIESATAAAAKKVKCASEDDMGTMMRLPAAEYNVAREVFLSSFIAKARELNEIMNEQGAWEDWLAFMVEPYWRCKQKDIGIDMERDTFAREDVEDPALVASDAEMIKVRAFVKREQNANGWAKNNILSGVRKVLTDKALAASMSEEHGYRDLAELMKLSNVNFETAQQHFLEQLAANLAQEIETFLAVGGVYSKLPAIRSGTSGTQFSATQVFDACEIAGEGLWVFRVEWDVGTISPAYWKNVRKHLYRAGDLLQASFYAHMRNAWTHIISNMDRTDDGQLHTHTTTNTDLHRVAFQGDHLTPVEQMAMLSNCGPFTVPVEMIHVLRQVLKGKCLTAIPWARYVEERTISVLEFAPPGNTNTQFQDQLAQHLGQADATGPLSRECLLFFHSDAMRMMLRHAVGNATSVQHGYVEIADLVKLHEKEYESEKGVYLKCFEAASARAW